MNKTIEDFFELIENYSEEEKQMIKKAYDLANKLHAEQKRDSGEPYIIHPINVAYNTASTIMDVDSICAAFLHDTLEDTDMTKQELTSLFNPTIADLVDGVTNFKNIPKRKKKTQLCGN